MAEDAPTISLTASLSRRLEEAAGILRKHRGMVRIVSHYDPDGMSAGAIASIMIRRLGLGFHTTLTRNLDDGFLADIRDTTPEDQILLFGDMGSAWIDRLEDFPHRIIVVDHHKPKGPGTEGGNVIHLNPHLFDIDGSREASGASFMFSLAIALAEENWDLAGLAVTGAVGDRQDLGGFTGYNEELVAAADAREILRAERMPLLRGHTIYESLVEHPEPYFKGITGRKREASRFIKWLGLGKEAELKDLDDQRRRFLASACVLRLLRQDATPEAVEQFICTRYWLYGMGMYADQLSALLNACSRQGELGMGLALALGDQEAMNLGMELGRRHREYIVRGLRELEVEPPRAMKHIQHFDCDIASYTGVLAGLGTLYLFDRSKATVGLAVDGDDISVSARAPRKLVESGIDLGAACRAAAEKVGGRGGGHNVAAGATVPSKARNDFLKELDRVVGEQLGN